MKTIEYGKSEYGHEFPLYQGELLSWSLSMTLADERNGFPKLRTVIRAMMDRRPEQLAKERYEMLRGSFDRVFGHNAQKCLEVIDSELNCEVRGLGCTENGCQTRRPTTNLQEARANSLLNKEYPLRAQRGYDCSRLDRDEAGGRIHANNPHGAGYGGSKTPRIGIGEAAIQGRA